MKAKIFLLVFFILLIAASLIFMTRNQKNDTTGLAINLKTNEQVNFYRSESCGCCSLYKDYLGNKGKTVVEDIILEDTTQIKQQYNIPTELQSCHTSIIGEYFIEGHVPLEAINKLLTEKPNLKGIAISGMPYGAPGMPGGKNSDFIIYGINMDGSYNEYMRM